MRPRLLTHNVQFPNYIFRYQLSYLNLAPVSQLDRIYHPYEYLHWLNLLYYINKVFTWANIFNIFGNDK